MRESKLNKYHFYKKETGLCFDPYYYFYEPIKVDDNEKVNLFVMQGSDESETCFGSTHNKHYSDSFFSVYNNVIETSSMDPRKKDEVYAKIVGGRYIEFGSYCACKDGKRIGRHYRYIISKYSNLVCEVYDGAQLIDKIEYDYKVNFIPRVKQQCLKVTEGNYSIDDKGKKIKELCQGGCELSNFNRAIGLKFENLGVIYSLDRKNVHIFIFDSEKGTDFSFSCKDGQSNLLIKNEPVEKYKIIKQ